MHLSQRRHESSSYVVIMTSHWHHFNSASLLEFDKMRLAEFGITDSKSYEFESNVVQIQQKEYSCITLNRRTNLNRMWYKLRRRNLAILNEWKVRIVIECRTNLNELRCREHLIESHAVANVSPTQPQFGCSAQGKEIFMMA